MTKTPGQVAREAWWKSPVDSDQPRCGAFVCRGDPEEWDDVAAAVIAHHEAEQWQPIETAPKDGKFLVSDGVTVATSWSRDNAKYYEFTHWRPLPVPPKARPE